MQTYRLASQFLRRMTTQAAASTAAPSRYDLVVFGATGYTGQYVVEEVARVAQRSGGAQEEGGDTSASPPLTWAIAGRSEHKLKDALAEASKETGLNLADVGLILADVKDQDSLNKMAAQSTVVINCVGPYQLYGEPLVRACIENKASHVDISGEPQFLEGMQLKYDQAAEEAGVHIVGACGYDSIPAEMGLVHMIKNFKGELNSAQMFVRFKNKGKGSAGIHTGTMESAALAIKNNAQIADLRRQLFPTPLPKPKFRVQKKGFHKNTEMDVWCVPLPTDEPVVYRTQRYRHDVLKQRPLQFQQFLSFRSFFQGLGTALGMAYFALLCYFSWTRALLLKFPEVMTAGVFKQSGAKREELKNLSFTATLVGRGWSQPLAEATDQYTTPPDSTITVQVSGPDPGYGGTSLMMVASALTLLKEKDLCARSGGVMTPGTAFVNTGLIDRLIERGMTVEVLDPK